MNNILITNNQGSNFLNELVNSLQGCHKFQLSVAFINYSGLQLLLDTLKELEERAVPGEVITSTYLNFTDPKALKKLKEFKNIELKIYPTDTIGFHIKGYLFKNTTHHEIYVGSSNITQSALKSNQEWNVKASIPTETKFLNEVHDAFHALWEACMPADTTFIEKYESFYDELRQKVGDGKTFKFERELKPNEMQVLALKRLNELRENKQTKALVIAATGSGKTIMAALDVKNTAPERVLFLVHREEILNASKNAFIKVLPEKKGQMGLLTGNVKQGERNFVFSTNLTMNNTYLDYSEGHFDYIVVDEAHHATSNSWIKVINYFKPKFLLGMTATPERTDGVDIYSLFDNNIALEVRLRDALEKDLVAPFHYFGIADETVDYDNINLTELDKIARLLKVNQRVDFIIEKMNFYGYDGQKRKTVGFCVTQDHAQFMSDEFNKRGIPSVSLNANNSISERKNFIAKLEDDQNPLEVIFTVDIFNEGVDIPTINSILMLRPTSSPIVFIQQLGRGLRKTETKEFLTVIDFIGNHTKTFLIAMALCGARAYDKDSLKEAVTTDFSAIPGCTHIQLDKISKERILEQIEATNFNSLKYLKEEYHEFKKLNLNKIPGLVDFLKFDGAPDPIKFIDHSKSLVEFIIKSDAAASRYRDLLLDSDFIKLIRQLSCGLEIKRPHEFAILEFLLDNDTITPERAVQVVSKYTKGSHPESVIHSLDYLSGKFDDGSQLLSKVRILERHNEAYRGTSVFNKVINNDQHRSHITDVLHYGLLRYEEEFGNEDYGYPFLKLYHVYTMKDLALLSNYTRTHSAFRGSGYFNFNRNAERFLWVDLHKDEDIEERINYQDKFVDQAKFQWQSPNSTGTTTETGKDMIYNTARGVNLHMFVRKIREIDGVTQPFIYLGRVNSTSWEGEKPITIQFQFENPVPSALYHELTSGA